MKKVFLVLTIVFGSAIVNAQLPSENSVEWAKDESWEHVLDRAKSERRIIFVDFIATWCAPCKAMNSEAFASKEVADFLKKYFIPLKIQIDSTKEDDFLVRRWYKDARLIRKRYNINSLPSFLFFSPDGELIHMDVGARSTADFIQLLTNAIDPNKQYFILKEKYLSKILDTKSFEYFARLATTNEDEAFAVKVSRSYIHYLFTQGDSAIFNPQNLEFLRKYTQSSKDKGFNFFYKNEARINDVMNDNYYAQVTVDYVLTKENVDPVLLKAVNYRGVVPNWNKLYEKLKRKYSKIVADRVILSAKERFYQYTDNFDELHKMYVRRYNMFGIEKFMGVNNNMAWDIFLKSNDTAVLNVAIQWMATILGKMPKTDPLYAWTIDTYANLLYKVGRVREAVDWEMIALEIEVSKGAKDVVKVINETLDKMKSGIATWPK